jgi:DNA-binding protein Fis
MAPPRAVYVDVLGRPLGDGFNLEDVLHEVGHHYLSRAMKDAEGTLAEATKLVGLANYQTLKSWLEKYGVER